MLAAALRAQASEHELDSADGEHELDGVTVGNEPDGANGPEPAAA